jgi:hypothetical protein
MVFLAYRDIAAFQRGSRLLRPWRLLLVAALAFASTVVGPQRHALAQYRPLRTIRAQEGDVMDDAEEIPSMPTFSEPGGVELGYEPDGVAYAEDLELFAMAGTPAGDTWDWRFFPRGLIYRSYLAGAKESRMRGVMFHEQDAGWIWDISLGGRAAIVRYGSPSGTPFPQGWELDIEGAAFPRLDLDVDRNLLSADFRFGVPLTYAYGSWQTKFAYYHLSSHLGDENIFVNGLTTRFNYSRDVLVWGISRYVTPSVRVYAEAGWAFYLDVSKPWEFQFGLDYSPLGPTGPGGSPFFAINGHLREELDFGGNLAVQTGWQWRDHPTSGILRAGLEYYNGYSEQFATYNEFENKVGFGLWYDF